MAENENGRPEGFPFEAAASLDRFGRAAARTTGTQVTTRYAPRKKPDVKARLYVRLSDHAPEHRDAVIRGLAGACPDGAVLILEVPPRARVVAAIDELRRSPLGTVIVESSDPATAAMWTRALSEGALQWVTT